MQNDDSARELWIETLLDDKQRGWAKAASIEYVREVCPPDASNEELERSARRVARSAWAYRDELEAMPSDELRRLASAATERSRLKRGAEDRQRRLDEQIAVYERWARKPFWKLDEAVSLVLGNDPDGDVSSRRFSDEGDDLTDLLERAIKAGKLKRDMSPAALLAFLRGVKVDVPAGLAKSVSALRPAKPAPKPTATATATATAEETPKAPASSVVDIPGYDCPPELPVMLEAIKQFWVNADRAKPHKGEGEIIPWIRKLVGSDQRAKAIDLLIRPEWARSGGNKKQSKG